MKIRVAAAAGEFISLDVGHLLPLIDLEPMTLSLGTRVSAVCMFTIHEVLSGSEIVALLFQTAFAVENKGGLLLTYMESKKGAASACSIVLRTPQLIVYDYTGVGALAVSTKVSDTVRQIFEAQ